MFSKDVLSLSLFSSLQICIIWWLLLLFFYLVIFFFLPCEFQWKTDSNFIIAVNHWMDFYNMMTAIISLTLFVFWLFICLNVLNEMFWLKCGSISILALNSWITVTECGRCFCWSMQLSILRILKTGKPWNYRRTIFMKCTDIPTKWSLYYIGPKVRIAMK